MKVAGQLLILGFLACLGAFLGGAVAHLLFDSTLFGWGWVGF